MPNPPSITFRPAAQRDIPLIRDLAVRIWREHYPGIISPEQIDYMLDRMYAADVISDEIERTGYRYVLAWSGNTPVGFITYLHEPAEQAVKISKLYLLTELHGRGIGRRLLDFAREQAIASSAKSIYLFVNKNNTKAIRAYERFGFRKAAETVTDIGNGFVMDDFRMELHL